MRRERLGLRSMELVRAARELSVGRKVMAQVLAVQIQAGGEGVDLHGSYAILLVSVGYQLAKYEQAKAAEPSSSPARPGRFSTFT